MKLLIAYSLTEDQICNCLIAYLRYHGIPATPKSKEMYVKAVRESLVRWGSEAFASHNGYGELETIAQSLVEKWGIQ